MLTFMHKVHRIAMDIMSCLAIGLGLPEDYYFQVQLFLLSSAVAFDCFCITCWLLPDAPQLQGILFVMIHAFAAGVSVCMAALKHAAA